MRTKIHDGQRLDFLAPYDINVDEPVLIGNMFGVAFISEKKDSRITIDTVGVHELPKENPKIFQMGEVAYYHKVNKNITNVSGTDTHPVGYFTHNEEEDSTKCFVRLTPTCTITIEQAGTPLSPSEENGQPSET